MKKVGYLLISYAPIPGLGDDTKTSYILIKYNSKEESSWMVFFDGLSIIDGTDDAIKSMFSKKNNLYFAKYSGEKPSMKSVGSYYSFLNGSIEADIEDEDAAKLLYEITR